MIKYLRISISKKYTRQSKYTSLGVKFIFQYAAMLFQDSYFPQYYPILFLFISELVNFHELEFLGNTYSHLKTTP